MKYTLLIYGEPGSWGHPMFQRARTTPARPREEQAELFEALLAEIRESGELAGGEPLADPFAAKSFRVRDGDLVVTEGPFAEAGEQLAGYLVLDCDSAERAAEIAARFPGARCVAVELRPVMNPSGQEM
jgi:hypothetical protein